MHTLKTIETTITNEIIYSMEEIINLIKSDMQKNNILSDISIDSSKETFALKFDSLTSTEMDLKDYEGISVKYVSTIKN